MKAIVQDTYGSADVLELRDIDLPEIADDQVLVRVHAAGVDRGVWHLMAGLPYPIRMAGYGVRAPKYPVPGMDLAGVVEAVGRDVTRFAPGDEVFGIGKGAFAEYAVAPEGKLAPKPANLTFEQAAADRDLRPDRPAGAARRGRRPGRAEGAGHRRLGRRGHLRGAGRQGVRRARDRRRAARPSSTWCGRSAPTRSSTTRSRTSPREAPATT